MFEDEEMDNDLKLVDTAIREYYGMIKKQEEETNGETWKILILRELLENLSLYRLAGMCARS